MVKSVFSLSTYPMEEYNYTNLSDLYLPEFVTDRVLIADQDAKTIKVLDLTNQKLEEGVSILTNKVYVTANENMFEYDMDDPLIPIIANFEDDENT